MSDKTQAQLLKDKLFLRYERGQSTLSFRALFLAFCKFLS